MKIHIIIRDSLNRIEAVVFNSTVEEWRRLHRKLRYRNVRFVTKEQLDTVLQIL